jgi:hypothetical protein
MCKGLACREQQPTLLTAAFTLPGPVATRLSTRRMTLPTLRRIVANDREPTPWGAGCLYAALCALSVGDHRTAEQKISMSMIGGTDPSPPVRIFPHSRSMIYATRSTR